MVSDWEKGNAYQFQIKEYPEHPLRNFVTNGKYSIGIKDPTEAKMVCNLLNEIMIGNGDGISKHKLEDKLKELIGEFMLYEMTFTERMMFERIFSRVMDVINNV